MVSSVTNNGQSTATRPQRLLCSNASSNCERKNIPAMGWLNLDANASYWGNYGHSIPSTGRNLCRKLVALTILVTLSHSVIIWRFQRGDRWNSVANISKETCFQRRFKPVNIWSWFARITKAADFRIRALQQVIISWSLRRDQGEEIETVQTKSANEGAMKERKLLVGSTMATA